MTSGLSALSWAQYVVSHCTSVSVRLPSCWKRKPILQTTLGGELEDLDDDPQLHDRVFVFDPGRRLTEREFGVVPDVRNDLVGRKSPGEFGVDARTEASGAADGDLI